MINRGTIIFIVILLIHSAINYLVPKDSQIFAYFAATLGPLIILLIAALTTQKEKFATWTILFLTTTLSYVISNAVIISFTNHVVKDTNLSVTLISQGITLVLYVVSKVWLRLTNKEPVSYKIAWLFATMFIVNIIILISRVYFTRMQTSSLSSTLTIFSVVLVFQALAVIAAQKWDTTQEQMN